MQEVSITEGKKNFPALVRLSQKGERITVHKRGEPVAVILPYSEYKNYKRLFDYVASLEISKRLEGSGLTASGIFEESRSELEGKSA